MSDVFHPPDRIRVHAHLSDMDAYRKKHEESVTNPSKFWGAVAKEFSWHAPHDEKNFLEYNFNVNEGPIKITWLPGAKTNICYNCLDRQLDKFGSQVNDTVLLTCRDSVL